MLRTPEQYHRKRHDGDFETCRSCAKASADCQRKLRFATVDEGLEWVRDFNVTHDYEVGLYFCRYGPHWHMKTNRRRNAPPAPPPRHGWRYRR